MTKSKVHKSDILNWPLSSIPDRLSATMAPNLVLALLLVPVTSGAGRLPDKVLGMYLTMADNTVPG